MEQPGSPQEMGNFGYFCLRPWLVDLSVKATELTMHFFSFLHSRKIQEHHREHHQRELFPHRECWKTYYQKCQELDRAIITQLGQWLGHTMLLEPFQGDYVNVTW